MPHDRDLGGVHDHLAHEVEQREEDGGERHRDPRLALDRPTPGRPGRGSRLRASGGEVDDGHGIDDEMLQTIAVRGASASKGATLVFKDVPAEVCPNCGEDYVDEAVTRALLKSAEDMVSSGAQVDIRTYASAA